MSRKIVIVALLLVPLSFALGRGTVDQKPPRYDNRALGFRLEGPDFSALGAHDDGTVVLMMGPVTEGFAPNLNVMLQPAQSVADYRRVTLQQLKQMNLELRTEEQLKVGGREALLLEYAGALQGRDMQFLALAVFDKERVFNATCSATPAQFAKLKTAFRASLDSFTFLDTLGKGAK